MFGHTHQSTWRSFMVLLSCCLCLVNTFTVITCGHELNSAGVPIRPPKTDVGSYMVYQNFRNIMHRTPIRDIYIYWQEIENRDKCGSSFEYHVSCSPIVIKNRDNNNSVTIPWKITKNTQMNYIKFEGLSTRSGFKFNVFSLNEQGSSKEFSTIYVPVENKRHPKQFSLTRMHLKEDGEFELSWNNYEQTCSDHAASAYTIYWCEKNMYHSNECHGHVSWVHVSCAITAYNITVKEKNKYYNFAISEKHQISPETGSSMTNSNITFISSGMVWESCKLQSNSMAGKIDKIIVNAFSFDDIQLHWILDCSNKITVLGYRLFYCKMSSKRYIQCNEPKIEIDLDMKNPYRNNTAIFKYDRVTALVIYGLQPLTTYQISIAVMTEYGEGLHSNPLFVTTKNEGEYHNSKTGGRMIPLRLFQEVPK